MLDERRNSYLLSVCMDGDRAGLAFVDVSTGEFQLYEIERASVRLQDEIVRMMPKEIIANSALPRTRRRCMSMCRTARASLARGTAGAF